MRRRVPLRAAGVFSIEQRTHNPSGEEFTTPQKGQTNCPSRLSRMYAAAGSSSAGDWPGNSSKNTSRISVTQRDAVALLPRYRTPDYTTKVPSESILGPIRDKRAGPARFEGIAEHDWPVIATR